MKGKYRYQLLFAMLFMAVMANAGPVEKINDIKRDPQYVYGEATKPTIDDAYDAALNILQSNIQKWYETRQKSNSGGIVRNLTFLADTIHTMRGNYHRVFAYVPIAKLEETLNNDAEEMAKARTGERPTTVDTSSSLHTDSQINEMLQTLANSQNRNQFVVIISQNKQNGLVSLSGTDITQQPSESYLAIFDDTKKNNPLLRLLKPGGRLRDDLISGNKIESDVYIQNEKAYRFIWFVLSKSN